MRKILSHISWFVALGMRSADNGPEKTKTNSCFLLHDNAPINRSVFIKDF